LAQGLLALVAKNLLILWCLFQEMIPVTDAHVHFLRSQFEYSWIDRGSPLDRDFLLEEYRQTTESLLVERIVFVECHCPPQYSVAEAEWVRDLSLSDPRIQGVVAHAELTDPLLDNMLDALSANPLVKGIRHNIQGQPPGFCLQDIFVEGVRKAWAKGFHFELCISHDQLQDAIDLVRLCPGVRFMLDHCGKPGIKAGLTEPWASQMQELAQIPDVYCKISGLVTEAEWQSWTVEQVTSYMKTAVEAFGADRIVYGGDWPIVNVAGGYARWYEVAVKFTRDWPDAEKHAFFHGNADRFYRL